MYFFFNDWKKYTLKCCQKYLTASSNVRQFHSLYDQDCNRFVLTSEFMRHKHLITILRTLYYDKDKKEEAVIPSYKAIKI